MKKYFLGLILVILLGIQAGTTFGKTAPEEAKGYVGTLPDLNKAYEKEQPKKINPDFRPTKDFNSANELKPVPRDNPAFVNIILKTDKTSKYVNDLNEFIPMLETMSVYKENMRNAAARGFINATDCADYLVKKGLPFRDAYKITGTLVAYCIKNQTVLENLSIEEFRELSPVFDDDVYEAIKLETCVNMRKADGGPAPEAVKKQIEFARKYTR